ncbi:hypothetical protein FA95DRAFT_1611748 [Auriscalpium vulgare]|uniref:Uncharacterized protein n=1 Tax=Auriscalpium vulgare TaxID=40419 RepID=A0ACB8R9N6_9AGAM|nr:hypothetical protein FA95DRAFT_1611748 [Auriscalpium vulgare]
MDYERLYYVVELATVPGLYDNLSSFYGALAGSPAFAYTVFPGIQDACRAWAALQFPEAFNAGSAAAWSLYPLDGCWSVRCNRPFDTVDTEDLWLFYPPQEEECEDPPAPASHSPPPVGAHLAQNVPYAADVPLVLDVGDAPSTTESAYMTPPASPTPPHADLLTSVVSHGPPPAPPPTPSFEACHGTASPGASQVALPLAMGTRNPA